MLVSGIAECDGTERGVEHDQLRCVCAAAVHVFAAWGADYVDVHKFAADEDGDDERALGEDDVRRTGAGDQA
jgi:hypothetical protein